MFKPADFNIVLMRDSGHFVKANFGNDFSQSLMSEDMTLPAGRYVLMVDPVWNRVAESDPSQFKQVLIDVYAPEAFDLELEDQKEGLEILASALKHAARTLSPEDKKIRYL